MGDLSPLLAVRDMKKTIEFYTRSLGFHCGMVFPNAENPEYADLSKDGMVLMVIPAKDHGIRAEETFGIGVMLYLHIDGDIDEYYWELKENGVRVAEDIKDEPYGVRDFTVTDPDGYQLTFTQATARQCMSCGMPMSKPDDFGGGNPANPCCAHCTHEDGSLKSYDDIFEGMVQFMMTSYHLERDAAEEKVRAYLAGMPAWENRHKQ
ncbi:VOC family protein [Methanogenium sp. S4BF]|uniref:VOC family protein n=1 Tax=Methanogenium sp. S4BF TaxID=1789226 RepID=UPI002416871E|nr:VOC family protein [Methanogenium sp. S4BF]WFN34218.1 VOC family protein [Methanogenium sp. S4BF]